ncbi:MAG: hypothetical protein NVSMB23_28460 [Myxococcales bacterium]
MRGFGFVVVTVALDRGADDARPWIDAARPTHPSLVDVTHRVADLYNMVNVPTVLWIDERGRVVRPNDAVFATDTFRHLTGIDSARELAAIRAWVRGETAAPPEEQVRALQPLPKPASQQARAGFGLGQWLFQRGRLEAAARHFARAGALAPDDFTIRRGTMPMRGIDPMGPEYRAMAQAWAKAGNSWYRRLPG